MLKWFIFFCGCSFIDLDTPLLLSEDPVYGGYEGILRQNPVHLQFPFVNVLVIHIQYSYSSVCFHVMPQMFLSKISFLMCCYLSVVFHIKNFYAAIPMLMR